MRCEQELCHRWNGEGCMCAVMGCEPDTEDVWLPKCPVHLVREPCPMCQSYIAAGL